METRSLGLLGLVALSALTAAPERAQAAQNQPAECQWFRGSPPLYFKEDPALGHTVVSEDVPEKAVGPNEAIWLAHPCMRKFQFSGYPYPNDAGIGTIYVFSIRNSYQSLYPHETIDFWVNGVDGLRDMLKNQPIWKPFTWEIGPVPEGPLLPVINAANVYVGRQKYVTLRQGEGVSYISVLAQDASPPSRDNTFYMFQGIISTDDNYYGQNAYYISAMFPVWLAHPPDTSPITDTNEAARVLARELQRAAPGDFNPSLDRLDRLVASFELLYPLPTEYEPGMPIAGHTQQPDAALPTLLLAATGAVAAGTLLRRRSRAV